jgi:thiol-disulfide isomerase/thioredoxin
VYLSKSRKKGGIVYFFLENAEILLTQSLDKKVIVSGSQSQTEYEDWISSTNTQTWQTLNDSIRDKFLRFSDISDKISAGIELDSLQKIRELRNIQAFYAFHEKYPSSNIKGFILENSLSQISLSEKEKLVTLCHKQDKESDFFRPYQVRMNVEKKVIGLSLYDIKILDTANYTKTLGDFKGKVLLVEFWASWCKPCRKKHREWQNMYKQYHPLGLEILSLSMDTEQGKWETAAKSDSISWGNIHEPRGFSSPLCQLFDIKHIPYYFFVNPEGIIEARNEDFISLIGRIEHHLGKH